VRAYRSFSKTMERVDALLALHPVLHGNRGRPAQHVADVLRGAHVLSVAALDAIVLGCITEALPHLIRLGRQGPNVAKWLREEPDKALTCFAAPDRHAALAALCRDKLVTITFQRSAMIQGTLREVLGCEPPWRRAAELLSASGSRLSEGDVQARLDGYVARRHRIVHDGDLKATSQGAGRTEAIKLSYVSQALTVIRVVGKAVDETVTEHLARARGD
jgi:hypothetical protein